MSDIMVEIYPYRLALWGHHGSLRDGALAHVQRDCDGEQLRCRALIANWLTHGSREKYHALVRNAMATSQ